MQRFPYLLADLDWIRLLFLFIFFFVVPGIAKLMGGGKDAAPPQKRVQRRPAPPQQPAPGQGGGLPQAGHLEPGAAGGRPARQAGGGNLLEDEIEAFLRRSRGEAPKPEPKPEPQREVVQESPREVRRLVGRTKSIKQQQARHGESVAEHVDRHIKDNSVSENSRELAQGIGQADEAMESHLHGVFDHKIGSLGKEQRPENIPEGTDSAVWETTESERRKSALAAEERTESIIGMLRDPESVKQAIILSELLKRPDF